MANDNVAARRAGRPLAVWLLSVGNGLMAIVLIATSFLAETRGYSNGLAAFYGFAGLAISIAAHLTWYGNRVGRLVLLILLTVYFGNIVGYSGWAIASGGGLGVTGDDVVTGALLRIGLSLVWLGLNYIFLFSKRAREFFG